jgi:hypothetical protein
MYSRSVAANDIADTIIEHEKTSELNFITNSLSVGRDQYGEGILYQGFRYCTTTAVLTSRIPSGALSVRTILPFSRRHSALIGPLGVGTTPLADETDAGGEGSNTNVS